MSTTEASSKQKKAPHKNKTKYSPPADLVSPNGASPRKKKREEVAQELAYELRDLRTTLDELLEHYRLRIGGQIAELEQALNGQPVEANAKRPSAKLSSQVLEAVRAESFKPKKGRAKDFVKLQRLVKELSELLPPEN